MFLFDDLRDFNGSNSVTAGTDKITDFNSEEDILIFQIYRNSFVEITDNKIDIYTPLHPLDRAHTVLIEGENPILIEGTNLFFLQHDGIFLDT